VTGYLTSLIILVSSILILMKIAEQWCHLWWVNRPNSRSSFAKAEQYWREREAVTLGSGEDVHFYQLTGRHVTALLVRLPGIPRKVILRIFWLPTIIFLQTTILALSPSPLVLKCGLFQMFVLLWSEVLDLITSRISTGHFHEYWAPVTDITRFGTSEPKLELHRRAVKGLLKVLVGFFLLSVIGYAGIYSALNTLIPGAVRDNVRFPLLPTFWGLLYFSITTMMTVGIGDLFPTTREARFFVASEVLLGFSLLVLLVTLLSFSVDEETRNSK
jgi:hypothetical protein